MADGCFGDSCVAWLAARVRTRRGDGGRWTASLKRNHRQEGESDSRERRQANRFASERPRKDRYLFGSFVVSFGIWVPAAILGVLIGDVLPDVLAFGLNFATPAIFIAFLIPLVRSWPAATVMLTAGALTVAGNEYLPSGAGPVVAIVAASILGGAWRSSRLKRH